MRRMRIPTDLLIALVLRRPACHRVNRLTIRSLALAADHPGPRGEPDCSVSGDRQIGTDAVAQSSSAILAEGHGVARSRTLTAKERCPVVVKIAKHGWHVHGARLDVVQPGVAENADQHVRVADSSEAAALV